MKGMAQRAFTVLVAGLLISSVVAPAAFSGSAAAATDDDHCTETIITKLVGNTCEMVDEPDTVNTSSDREKAFIQSDLHAEARTAYESSEQMQVVFSNYAEDTNTLASLEARNAIATAYENNESASVADTKAQTAIQDYYSIRQVNALEAFSKEQAQMAYAARVANNDSRIGNRFFYPAGVSGEKSSSASTYYARHERLTGNTVTKNYTLANGSTHEYIVAEWYVNLHSDDSNSHDYYIAPSISDFETTDEVAYNLDGTIYWGGMTTARASYWDTTYDVENGHPAQVVSSYNEWAEVLAAFGNQSDTVESNYAAGTASDMYAAMDEGRVEPAEVRGAEGQVRFLSGDSNATDKRFRAALYGSLNMSQAGFNSTFAVHYDGYTEFAPNETNNGTMEYSSPVNTTYDGMLFAQEVPEGGFEAGTTYNTEDLNGSVMIYTSSGQKVVFEKGNFTINEITDNEGNKVESVSWEKPKYETSNTSEYIEYLDKTQEMQLRLLEKYSDDTSSGGGGGGGGWFPSEQRDAILAGLALIAVAGLAGKGS